MIATIIRYCVSLGFAFEKNIIMNTEEFRVAAKKMVDYICEFRRTIPEQRVVPGPEITANGLKKILDGELWFDRIKMEKT